MTDQRPSYRITDLDEAERPRERLQRVRAQRGIGEAKAAQVKAAIELGRRLAAEAPDERPAVHSPQDAADLVRYEMSALEQEELRVLLLDNRNRLIAVETVYRGSVNSTQGRGGELFEVAVRGEAVRV